MSSWEKNHANLCGWCRLRPRKQNKGSYGVDVTAFEPAWQCIHAVLQFAQNWRQPMIRISFGGLAEIFIFFRTGRTDGKVIFFDASNNVWTCRSGAENPQWLSTPGTKPLRSHPHGEWSRRPFWLDLWIHNRRTVRPELSRVVTRKSWIYP